MNDKIPRHKNPVQETFRISMEQMDYLVRKHFGRNQLPFLLDFVETCNENEEQFEDSNGMELGGSGGTGRTHCCVGGDCECRLIPAGHLNIECIKKLNLSKECLEFILGEELI